MAELTDSQSTFAAWVKDYLDTPEWRDVVGIQMVTYGDQEKISVVPMVCVEPSDKRREFNGVGRRTRIDFEIYVLVYYGTLESVQVNRQTTDELAEAIEARLHAALTCDGLVINSLVTRVESGVANKGGSKLRASRLTFTAQSQVHLPMGV